MGQVYTFNTVGAPVQIDDDNERFMRNQALTNMQGNQAAQVEAIRAAAMEKLQRIAGEQALQQGGDFQAKTARDFGLEGIRNQGAMNLEGVRGKNQLGVMQAQMAPSMMGAQLATRQYDDDKARKQPLYDLEGGLIRQFSQGLFGDQAPSAPASPGASTPKADTSQMDWNGPAKDVLPLDPRATAATGMLQQKMAGGQDAGMDRNQVRKLEMAARFLGRDIGDSDLREIKLEEARTGLASKQVQALIDSGDIAGATALAKQRGVKLPSTLDSRLGDEYATVTKFIEPDMNAVVQFITDNNWSIAGNQDELRQLYDQVMNKVRSSGASPKTVSLIEGDLKAKMAAALRKPTIPAAGTDATRRNFGLGGGGSEPTAQPQLPGNMMMGGMGY